MPRAPHAPSYAPDERGRSGGYVLSVRGVPGVHAWEHLGAVVAAVLVGGAVTYLPPHVVLPAAVGLATAVALVVRFGRTGLAMLLVLTLALLPVVKDVQFTPSTIFGQPATNVRTALTLALTFAAIIALGARFLSDAPVRVRRFMTASLGLAVLGIPVAFFAPFPDPSGRIDGISHTAGQPLAYALIVAVFVSVIRSDPRGRERLLVTWCVAILAEAALVAVQFHGGSSYDTLRHYSRAYGTMGPDFLAAFMLLGAFAAMSLRSSAQTRWERNLGTLAAPTALVVMIAATARASLIGFGVGTLLFLITGRAGRRRIALAVVIVGAALFAMQGLWATRLQAQGTQGFDRAATWVVGLRMASDHPLTGVGSTNDQLVEALDATQRYRQTQFGVTGSLPHNAWIIALGGNGVLYGLLFIVVTGRFVGMVRRGGRNVPERYLVAGVAGCGVTYFVNTMFNHPEITTFMLLAAVMLACSSDRPSTRITP